MRSQSLLIVGLLCSVLASCNIAPTVARKADGSVVATMGGSVLHRNKGLAANITMPDGTSINYKVDDSDGTAVASNYITGQVTKSVMGSLVGLKTTLSNNATKQAINASNNATAVKTATIGAQTSTTNAAIGSGAQVAPVTTNAP